MLPETKPIQKLQLLWGYCGLLCLSFLFLLSSCKKDDVNQSTPHQDLQSATAATKWADMSLYVIRRAKFNSPTYSSRSLGYLGLTMYESVVYADPALRSMKNQLNGLTTLPTPEPGASYQWTLVLNAAEAAMLKYLYPINANISQALLNSIDSLSGALAKEYSRGLAQETVDRSIYFGESLAAALYQWSRTDGGDNGFQRHFDPSFGFPSGPSYWVPLPGDKR